MSEAQILVVDDEPDIRQLVQEILEDEGYSVQVAKDGENARLVYAQQKPDLVLLDIWMPDIDGISLLKEWSASGSIDSQVVIMSGHGTLETAVEATRLGAFDFYPEAAVPGQITGNSPQGPRFPATDQGRGAIQPAFADRGTAGKQPDHATAAQQRQTSCQ